MASDAEVPPHLRRPRLERADGLPVPALYRAPQRRTPIVVWASWAWRPGLLLGWRRGEDGWSCHIRYRFKGEDVEEFVRYVPDLIIPVTLDADGDWWLPG